MNAQAVTGRMLESLSANKNALIEDYLLAFGVTKYDNDSLPPVFKSSVTPQWEVFNRNLELRLPPKAGKKKACLYRILEFVRYMQEVGINPFSKTFKHPRQTKLSSTLKFKSSQVYEKIVSSSFDEIVTSVDELLRKNHLNYDFKVEQTDSEIILEPDYPVSGAYSLICGFVLVPRRKKESIENILTKLQKVLYNGSRIPEPLLERKQVLPKGSRAKPKVLNDKAKVLLNTRSFQGWFPIRRTENFHAYLIRARDDRLVFKILVRLEIDISLGKSTKNVLYKLWTQASKSIKLK